METQIGLGKVWSDLSSKWHEILNLADRKKKKNVPPGYHTFHKV